MSKFGVALVCLLAQAAVLPAVVAQTALTAADAARLKMATTHFAEDVRRSDWTHGAEQLQQVVRVLQPLYPGIDTLAASVPGKAVVRAFRALHHRDRPDALHAANKLRLWTVLEAFAKSSDVAPEVARFGYLARELEIDLDNADLKRCARRLGELRQCWQRLKPWLEARDAAEEVREGEEAFRTVTTEAPETLKEVVPELVALAQKLEQRSGQ